MTNTSPINSREAQQNNTRSFCVCTKPNPRIACIALTAITMFIGSILASPLPTLGKEIAFGLAPGSLGLTLGIFKNRRTNRPITSQPLSPETPIASLCNMNDVSYATRFDPAIIENAQFPIKHIAKGGEKTIFHEEQVNTDGNTTDVIYALYSDFFQHPGEPTTKHHTTLLEEALETHKLAKEGLALPVHQIFFCTYVDNQRITYTINLNEYDPPLTLKEATKHLEGFEGPCKVLGFSQDKAETVCETKTGFQQYIAALPHLVNKMSNRPDYPDDPGYDNLLYTNEGELVLCDYNPVDAQSQCNAKKNAYQMPEEHTAQEVFFYAMGKSVRELYTKTVLGKTIKKNASLPPVDPTYMEKIQNMLPKLKLSHDELTSFLKGADGIEGIGLELEDEKMSEEIFSQANFFITEKSVYQNLLINANQIVRDENEKPTSKAYNLYTSDTHPHSGFYVPEDPYANPCAFLMIDDGMIAVECGGFQINSRNPSNFEIYAAHCNAQKKLLFKVITYFMSPIDEKPLPVPLYMSEEYTSLSFQNNGTLPQAYYLPKWTKEDLDFYLSHTHPEKHRPKYNPEQQQPVLVPVEQIPNFGRTTSAEIADAKTLYFTYNNGIDEPMQFSLDVSEKEGKTMAKFYSEKMDHFTVFGYVPKPPVET